MADLNVEWLMHREVAEEKDKFGSNYGNLCMRESAPYSDLSYTVVNLLS